MKHTVFVTPSGDEMVIISKTDFEDMIDAAAFAEAERADTLSGGEDLTHEEMKALIEAPTPLAFWREKRGMKQKELAAAAKISPNYLCALEAGKRKGDPALFGRLAAALRTPIEVLIVDEE